MCAQIQHAHTILLNTITAVVHHWSRGGRHEISLPFSPRQHEALLSRCWRLKTSQPRCLLSQYDSVCGYDGAIIVCVWTLRLTTCLLVKNKLKSFSFILTGGLNIHLLKQWALHVLPGRRFTVFSPFPRKIHFLWSGSIIIRKTIGHVWIGTELNLLAVKPYCSFFIFHFIC